MATKKKARKSGGGMDACCHSPTKYISPADRKSGPWEEYEVRNALSTLADADKIKRNKGLMALIRIEARKQLETATNVAKTV